MNTIVYGETLTGRPHDTSVQKATSDNEMRMQFNVMPRTHIDDYNVLYICIYPCITLAVWQIFK